MKQVINMVTGKFVELLKKNKMLGVEILFRWPSREIKDQILNNYDRGGNMNNDNLAVEQHRKQRVEENAIDLDNFDH